MMELGVSNYPVYRHVVINNRPDLTTYTWSQQVYTLGNYLHLGPLYNRSDLNTYTWSQHGYTLGNYLHQGPSYNRSDLNTYTWSQHVYTLGNYLHLGPLYSSNYSVYTDVVMRCMY
jgi:galactose mutarotase-like enzyme